MTANNQAVSAVSLARCLTPSIRERLQPLEQGRQAPVAPVNDRFGPALGFKPVQHPGRRQPFDIDDVANSGPRNVGNPAAQSFDLKADIDLFARQEITALSAEIGTEAARRQERLTPKTDVRPARVLIVGQIELVVAEIPGR